MKLGIGSYTYAWSIGIPGHPPPVQPMDAMGLIEQAHELGIGLVQIADNLPLHKLSDDQLRALHERAKQLGIGIEVGTRGITPDHLLRYLDLAQQFASPILRVVIDTATHRPEVPEIVALLSSVMPRFEAAGVKLAIENHDRFKARTLVQILQGVNSLYIGICLDTVNSFGAGEGPEVVVETFRPYVLNLHIKDFIIRRHPTMLGFEVQGAPAGQGMLNIPWLLDQLAGRSFNAILELWTPPEPTTEASIHTEEKWAVESIRYLRTLIEA